MSQDAKFFQRGKIQVRVVSYAYPRATQDSCIAQEFRQELQAAETKDKKFTKRKTVLKKIVANITMGNDSSYCDVFWRVRAHGSLLTVSSLFVDVVQCLGTPLLEIKKSASAYSLW
jgi:AP-2 complex subunit beta-1